VKKTITLILAIILTLTAVSFSGCNSKEGETEATSVNTSTLERIKIYQGDKDGELLTTIKGSNNDAMSIMNQIFAETKSTKEKEKEDVSSASEEYFVELLNYETDGTSKDSNYFSIYILDDKVYCYYPDEQSFSGTEYYICGYTSVTKDSIESLINGENE
jgi:type II secretory pathway pseudopilin PulG